MKNKPSFAVMGNPIDHSLSPLIHQQFAMQMGKQLSYKKIPIDDEALFEQQVTHFFAAGGIGLNISLPFKQRAFAMAAKVTFRCQQARAANTLWLINGQLHADNTDGMGLLSDLSRYLDLKGKHVLLLGAGGAARGIIAPLLAANIAKLTVVNRDAQRLKRLQLDFPPINGCSLGELNGCYDLIINATSISLMEKTIPLPQAILQPSTFCYDLVYAFEKPTAFVQWAREQGCAAIDGLGMLIEQAAEAFFVWHGVRPETTRLLKELHLLSASQKISRLLSRPSMYLDNLVQLAHK